MELFNANNFAAGLDGEFNRLLTPQGAYPLLVNGRNRTGVVAPVHSHVELTGFPSGTLGGLDVVGNLLVLFSDGLLYYKDLATDGPWTQLPSWSALNTTAEIYTELIPVQSNFFNRAGTPDSVSSTFNPLIAPSPAGLFVTDGINQARVVGALGGIVTCGTYESWSADDPNYVPLGVIPRVTRSKLYLVAADRKRVFQSVSGRFTDFLINIDGDGNKGGRADTMQVAVDANDLTNVVPTQDGGFIASTLYATYFVTPDPNEQYFGEYRLIVNQGFPVGAVNHKSTVDIGGDTAFISPSGIQSFNVTAQTKRESNNYPLGAKISRYLANPQQDTCAVNFDDYALFAVNTTFGRAVAVYDTIRQQFVSIDTGFGTVKKFAVYRAPGVQRLFFINTDNRLYEAYAGAETAICRLLLGDYSSTDAGKMHKVTKLFVAFTGVQGAVDVKLDLIGDNRLIESVTGDLSGDQLIPPAPSVVPFLDLRETAVFEAAIGTPKLAYKTSLMLSWSGVASLASVKFDGSAQESSNVSGRSLLSTTVPTKVAALGNLLVGSSLPQSIRLQHGDPSFMLLGNVTSTAGSEANYTSLLAVMTNIAFTGGAGNLELDTNSGRTWFNRHERYFKHTVGAIDFFVLNPGWNSANDSVDANGNAGTSIAPTSLADQLVWLEAELAASTNSFKVVVTAFPPYSDTDGDYPGYAALRAEYKSFGADLLIAGHSAGYQRFYLEGFPYIVAGTGGLSTDTWENGVDRSVYRDDTVGYLLLTATPFELLVEYRDADHTILDATTIYPS